MAGVTVVNIWRRKCDHRGEERLISVVLNKETFESFEDKFVCPNSLLEISLSGDEKGPWSKLDDDVLSDLYKAPMGVVFKTFPQTKYIRLQCIPINEDCQQDSTNNAITTGSTPRNAFQVLMDASKSTTNHTVPSKKRSRCKLQEFPNDTYAIQSSYHSLLINTTIPMLDDDGYDSCHVIVNGSKTTCKEWVFDHSVFSNTIRSQFNLVCDSKLSNSHATASYFIGLMTSPFILNPFGDIIGRRMVTCLSLTMLLVVRVATAFSIDVYMFAVLRFLDGILCASMFTTACVIGLELLSADKRMIAGSVIPIVYSGGEFILVLLAYFIRDWRWLQLGLTLPLFITPLYWWPSFLPESVRWLLSKGRTREALKILRHAADTNKTSFPETINLSYVDDKTKVTKIIKELLSSRKLLMYFGITSANWFVILFIFYGIKLNVGHLGGNIYMSFTLIVVAETFGYFLMFTMDRIGHKRLHVATLGLTCLVCLSSIFPILLDKSPQWITVMFALLGMVFVSTTYAMISVYAAELFPTVVRQFVLGTGFFFGGIGSLCSPYLYHLAEGKLKNVVPLILYGIISTVVTLLTLLLPETNKRRLPDNVKESEGK